MGNWFKCYQTPPTRIVSLEYKPGSKNTRAYRKSSRAGKCASGVWSLGDQYSCRSAHSWRSAAHLRRWHRG